MNGWTPIRKQIRHRPDELGARRKAFLQEMAFLVFYAWGVHKIDDYDNPQRPYDPDFDMTMRGTGYRVYGTPLIKDLNSETVRRMAFYIGCSEAELKKL